jgi:hypothetical protein
MQRERMSAAEMAAWFRDHEPRSTSYRASVPVDELARLFVEEGRAEGVAGDLAFAQSVLETGWFRWPSHGQVTPTHNNFGGIGACDGGTCTVARFPSARIGVRAQIQHLRAYADPTVTTANLAYPLESPRFHLVLPKGRAPYWEQFGSGNWATDPAYGSKILTLHRSMLTYATAEVAAAQRFRDVPPSHAHHEAIERLAATGVVQGCTSTTFCPAGSLTRGQLAALLTRAYGLSTQVPAAPYRDADGAHATAIAAVHAAGIASGYPDGTFRPHAPVTRGPARLVPAGGERAAGPGVDLPRRAQRPPAPVRDRGRQRGRHRDRVRGRHLPPRPRGHPCAGDHHARPGARAPLRALTPTRSCPAACWSRRGSRG